MLPPGGGEGWICISDYHENRRPSGLGQGYIAWLPQSQRERERENEILSQNSRLFLVYIFIPFFVQYPKGRSTTPRTLWVGPRAEIRTRARLEHGYVPVMPSYLYGLFYTRIAPITQVFKNSKISHFTVLLFCIFNIYP